jgi:GTP-binding protein HflX
MDEQKQQLDVQGKPMIEVLNKVDLISPEQRVQLAGGASGGLVKVPVSGLTKFGLEELLEAIDAALVVNPLIEARFRIPQSEGATLAALDAGAVWSSKRFEGNLVSLTVRGPDSLLERYRRSRERS